MMFRNRIVVFVFLLTAALLFSGCDWVKRQLGMATSDDIEQLRMRLEMQAMQQKKLHDSLEAVKQDSLRRAEELATQSKSHLNMQFYVIAGSYREVANANAMEQTLIQLGYTPVRIELNNGFEMVAAIGTETLQQACSELKRLADTDVSTFDIWIYNVNQALHKE